MCKLNENGVNYSFAGLEFGSERCENCNKKIQNIMTITDGQTEYKVGLDCAVKLAGSDNTITTIAAGFNKVSKQIAKATRDIISKHKNYESMSRLEIIIKPSRMGVYVKFNTPMTMEGKTDMNWLSKTVKLSTEEFNTFGEIFINKMVVMYETKYSVTIPVSTKTKKTI